MTTAPLHSDHAHGGHSPELSHHFEDLSQQKEAVTLGMWLFLVTEAMFFGGALLAYSIYRATYPTAFAAASSHESWQIGALNTGVLLCSSLTVALAVHAAHERKHGSVIRYLLITIVLACLFIGVKGFEYSHLIHENHAPFLSTFAFHPEQYERPARIFFSLYFALTGIHALHMVIGIGLFAWLIILARSPKYQVRLPGKVEMTGLYWHFVDIVWIFLYPLLYLVDRVHQVH